MAPVASTIAARRCVHCSSKGANAASASSFAVRCVGGPGGARPPKGARTPSMSRKMSGCSVAAGSGSRRFGFFFLAISSLANERTVQRSAHAAPQRGAVIQMLIFSGTPAIARWICTAYICGLRAPGAAVSKAFRQHLGSIPSSPIKGHCAEESRAGRKCPAAHRKSRTAARSQRPVRTRASMPCARARDEPKKPSALQRTFH